MDIALYRLRRTRWGIDGVLKIDGHRVAYTAEHPDHHLPPGTYRITLRKMILKPGCGPFLNLDSSICVGRPRCAGCLVHPKATFRLLYARIQKSLRRGHPVTLIIR